MRTIPNGAGKTFDFMIEGGDEVYSLPLARYMPVALTQRLSRVLAMPDGEQKELEATDAMLDLLRTYMGEAADTLTLEAMQAIFEAWQENGGDELGES